MPSTSFLHSLMERKKANKDGTDELAVVKAAAWAWYQHGSGSEGKPMSEFDVTRTHRPPRPSRYKIEAMRTMEDDVAEGLESETPSLVHADNSLLDSFEIHSISKQLDDLIESRGNSSYGKFFGESDLHRRKMSLSSYDDGVDKGSSSPRKQQKKKKKLFKGFWLRHGVTCGSTQDVDTRAFVNGRQLGKVFR